MFIVIFVTSLVTLIIIVITSAAYLISLICLSDDVSPSEALAIDAQDFSTTPTISPVDVINHTLHRELSSRQHQICHEQQQLENADSNSNKNQVASIECSSSNQPIGIQPNNANNDLKQQLGGGTKTKDTVQKDIINSKPFNQAVKATDSNRNQNQQTNNWNSVSTNEHKVLITNQLGSSASKLLFDDFDQKEMQFGGTGLHWCKSRKSLDKLVALGLPLDIVNSRNETALHVAIRRKKLQVFIGLLSYGANVECRNENGETPLILSCKVNDIFACQLLLVFDANIDSIDKLGFSARHYAASICDRHKIQQQKLPSAAHLILAMLNEIGAKRCPKENRYPEGDDDVGASSRQQDTGHINNSDSSNIKSINSNETSTHTTFQSSRIRSKSPFTCVDGCSYKGTYNGNSYNRWPDYTKESLYKRSMFSDIIDEQKRIKKEEIDRQRSSSSSNHHHYHDNTTTTTTNDRNNQEKNGGCPKRSRMLCIDGGGMRGIIVCQIMIEMEKYLKKPLISYFDWVGGTSVGAFISCALCNGTSLHKLRRITFDVKDEVFTGSKPYNSKFLERVLKRTFGSGTKLSDVKGKKLAVTTVIADRDPCQLRFFRNYTSPSDALELYGYSPDEFYNLSGHATMIRCREAAPTTTNNKSLPGSTSTANANANAAQTNVASGTVRSSIESIKSLETNLIKDIEIATKFTSTNTNNNNKNNKASSEKDVIDSIDENEERDAATATATTTTTGTNQQVKNKTTTTTGNIEYVIDENEQDPLMWQAVRASAAAPFFFKPYGPYLDGGIISNNPTMDMLTEFQNYESVKSFLKTRMRRDKNRAEKHFVSCRKSTDLDSDDDDDDDGGGGGLEYPPPPPPPIKDQDRKQHNNLHEEPPGKLELIVSLGTGRGRIVGRQTMIDFGQVASGFATVFSPVELLRSIRAARDLFKKLMQQSCHTEDHILDRAQAWCASLKIPYFRINPALATIFSIDEKRDEQLINAIWQTKLYMRAMGPQLKQLGELLDGTESNKEKEEGEERDDDDVEEERKIPKSPIENLSSTKSIINEEEDDVLS